MNFMSFQGPTFTMQVPSNWFVTSSPKFQAMFVAPPGENGVRANLAVSLTPVKENVTLEEIVKAARVTQQKEYPEYQIISEGAVSINSLEGFERIYRWHNQSRGLHVIQRQFFCLVSQVLYTITATRENNEKSEMLDPIFKKMIESFRIGV